MTFEKWWEDEARGVHKYSSEYDLTQAAWQAATLAERERAAKVVDRLASWIDGYCQSHVVIKDDVLNAIRKGEGV